MTTGLMVLEKSHAFETGKIYPVQSSKRLTWPLKCRSAEAITVSDSSFDHPDLNSTRHQRMFQSYLDYFESFQGFKVLVMSVDGAWSWRSRPTYEAALKDAMTSCAGNTNLAGCSLFAVGDTIVWHMTRDEQTRVIAEYKATRKATTIDTTAPSSSGAFASFQKYEQITDDQRFKVFVLSESGVNWRYSPQLTYEEALKDAMDNCHDASRRGFCRLFAVGNTVVWDMSENERNAVIEAYRNKNKY